MKQLILILLLFCNVNIFSKDYAKYYRLIKGQWIKSTVVVQQSCGVIGWNSCVNPFSECDSFIVFTKKKKFYTDRNYVGKYNIENVSKTDTITECKLYLNLDSIQYDITIYRNYLTIEKYYSKYEDTYRLVLKYYLVNKRKYKPYFDKQ